MQKSEVDKSQGSSSTLEDLVLNREHEFPLPDDWTVLIHGANMDNAEWSGDKAHQLDKDDFTVARLGLSVVSKKEKDLELERLKKDNIPVIAPDTTATYASGQGIKLRLEIAFPSFHSRMGIPQAEITLMTLLSSKYGKEKAKEILELCNLVYWRNDKGGRHPVLPSGMVLIKLSDQFTDNQTRIIRYVPRALHDIYMLEINARSQT